MAFKRFVLSFIVAAAWLFPLSSLSQAEPRQIVGFGDSLMAGYGLNPGQSFPEKLQTALLARGHDIVIANAGVSGDTTSGGLARLDWSVPEGTDIVILELGANDMLRGVGPDIIEKNLDAMLSKLKARGIVVLLAGMRAAPNLRRHLSQARRTIRRRALPVLPRRCRRRSLPVAARRIASDGSRHRSHGRALPADNRSRAEDTKPGIGLPIARRTCDAPIFR
jgi:acyl-CoA thioesterase-1